MLWPRPLRFFLPVPLDTAADRLRVAQDSIETQLPSVRIHMTTSTSELVEFTMRDSSGTMPEGVVVGQLRADGTSTAVDADVGVNPRVRRRFVSMVLLPLLIVGLFFFSPLNAALLLVAFIAFLAMLRFGAEARKREMEQLIQSALTRTPASKQRESQ
jgi:hypothetical protein